MPPNRWLTLALVALGVFVTALDNSIVNVALPSIQEDLDLGLSGTAWVVNAYILAFAALLITGGRLADSVGRRRIFLTGLLVFTSASLGAGLAHSATVLILMRVLQGVGAALLTPPTLAILNHTFRDDPKARATAVGLWGSVAALAFALGPVIGGVLTEHAGWRCVFFVNVPIGALGLLAGARLIPESSDPSAPRRPDLAGLTTSAAALLAATYVLLAGNQRGWDSPVIFAGLAVAVAAAIGFVAAERRAAAPAVDLSLFRIPAFSGANAAVLILNLGTFGVFLYTSLFFQDVLGYSPVKSGAALLPWIISVLLLGPFTGRLSQRVPPRALVATGLAVMAAGLLLLTGIDADSRYLDLVPGLVLGGLGGGLTIPLGGVALAAVPIDRSGVASGVFNTAREAGGSIGIAVIGAVVGTSGGMLEDSYASGIAVAAGLALAAALLAAVTLREASNGLTETSVATVG